MNILPLLKKLDNEQIMSEFMFYVSKRVIPSVNKVMIDDYVQKKLGFEGGLDLHQRTYDNIQFICSEMGDYVLKGESGHIVNTLRVMDANIPRYGSHNANFERFFICQMWLYFIGLKKYRIKKCERCGNAFVGSRLGQKYCSSKCKNREGQKAFRSNSKLNSKKGVSK